VQLQFRQDVAITTSSVAERIEASSGKALPVVADITFQQAGSLNEESPHL